MSKQRSSWQRRHLKRRLHRITENEGGPLQLDASGSNFTDAIVLGLEAPTPYVRPFADLYLVDILDRESAVGVNLLMGVQVRLPTRRSS